MIEALRYIISIGQQGKGTDHASLVEAKILSTAMAEGEDMKMVRTSNRKWQRFNYHSATQKFAHGITSPNIRSFLTSFKITCCSFGFECFEFGRRSRCPSSGNLMHSAGIRLAYCIDTPRLYQTRAHLQTFQPNSKLFQICPAAFLFPGTLFMSTQHLYFLLISLSKPARPLVHQVA